MKIVNKLVALTVLLVLMFGSSVSAGSTMTWSFSLYNDPYAEQIALERAQVQDELWNPKDEFGGMSSIEMFKDMLLRQMLTRISSEIIEERFGRGIDFEDGQYSLGDYDVTFIVDGQGTLIVTLTDRVTGETTVIEIPSFGTQSSTNSVLYDGFVF